ncbi:hypothetical protein PACTADRAFT_47444 [Pachysolen tannophilus NRRL Y-2460]|uniref:Heme-binding protein HMX1 n=1 Tax=Pachysolen tannophilus NRRL Y-2460 TaxID=669874 RepID=A0A1E4U0L4_PACTA|nr:hypothetical protein PACTADRAFT_47444 [Pachysolen tannophilus NRRL Y-2460]
MTTKFTQQEILPLKTDVGALGNRINLETRANHNKVDKMMTLKFALAIRDRKIYRQGIQMYYHIFKAIEFSLDREFARADSKWAPLLKEIWKPAIARKDRLFQDLLFYYGEDESKFSNPILQQQIDFVSHIKKITDTKPYLLLAYMHVMYLALFAGGRLFRSKLAHATGLFPKVPGKTMEEVSLQGTNFFRFEVEDEDALRIAYKRDYELNTRNNLTEAQKLEIIEEAKYIFDKNADCVKEIESHNLKRLRSKVSYKVAVYGYYSILILSILVLCYYARRIILNF